MDYAHASIDIHVVYLHLEEGYIGYIEYNDSWTFSAQHLSNIFCLEIGYDIIILLISLLQLLVSYSWSQVKHSHIVWAARARISTTNAYVMLDQFNG